MKRIEFRELPEKIRLYLMISLVSGSWILLMGAGSNSLNVTILPSPSGTIAMGDTNAFLMASVSCAGTNVTTNGTTYSWTGTGVTNSSIQSITTPGITNISLTATHIYSVNNISYTNTGSKNISITIVGVSNIVGLTNVLAGSTTNYTANASGSGTFPNGWPKWETNRTAVAATTATIPVTFPTNPTTNFNVKATAGTSSTNLNVNVIKVTRITPANSPVTATVDGADGTAGTAGANEYTFSTNSSGIITLKLKAKVDGLSTMDVATQNAFRFDVEAVGDSTLAWEATNPNGQPTINGDFLEATVTFTGLPTSNSGFGLKTAKVKFYSEEVPTEFEVFFAKEENNHPGTGNGSTSNWYYYWASNAVSGYDLASSTYSYAIGTAGEYAQYNSNPSNPQYTIHGPASAGHENYSDGGIDRGSERY